MWLFLAGLAGLSLFLFFRGPNAVWGGLTLGAIVGLLWAIVSAVLGHGFELATIGKGAVVGSLLGAATELVGKLGRALKSRPER